MWALVTGASSGIGRDMSRYLWNLGYSLIIVARDKDKLEKLREKLEKNRSKNAETKQEIIVIPKDLSIRENCIEIYEETKNLKIELLVNNAGFGVFGEFNKTDLEKEINLINTNITALHILTKLYLQDMIKRNNGHILNVASIAGMEPGPLMATYYASKAYVIRLSRAINKELKKEKSNVKISVFMPGPVDTNFNNVANVVFKAPSMPSEKVAKIWNRQSFKRKTNNNTRSTK